MKPSKHQRSKQRCLDSCWKVHDRAQSFVSRSQIIHELRNQTFLLVSFSVRSKQLLCFVDGQGQKSEQKHTTKKSVGFQNHTPLVTILSVSDLGQVITEPSIQTLKQKLQSKHNKVKYPNRQWASQLAIYSQLAPLS